MGLNHSCVSSSKKKKASHIHDSSYQGFVNNLPGDLTTRCNYDQGDMPSASSPPVKRLANTKTRLSSSSEKNDNLAYSYNSLSQSRSVFVKDENHSKSGQIQNSTSCSTNDVRSLRNAGDNECYNPKFTSLAPEEHLMSSNIESDNGISLLGNRPSLTIKVINTNEGRQVHVLRRGSLSGIHTFAKEISLGDQALSRQGDSIGFLSANSRHTQSDTITILRPSTCALGHESKQRRRIMMSNLQGKSNKTVACTRRALSGKAERCFTQQALDSSEYSPGKIKNVVLWSYQLSDLLRDQFQFFVSTRKTKFMFVTLVCQMNSATKSSKLLKLQVMVHMQLIRMQSRQLAVETMMNSLIHVKYLS